MSVLLFTLPLELVDEIFSYLSERDFRRFSRCSHACRNFIIPLVFNRIEWRTPSKAAAFRDGEIVGHLRPAVHHISMHTPGYLNELLRTIDAFQVYMDVLALFPNITSLWIKLSTIAEIEANLIHAIFTKLSTSPLSTLSRASTLHANFFQVLPRTISPVQRIKTTLRPYRRNITST